MIDHGSDSPTPPSKPDPIKRAREAPTRHAIERARAHVENRYLTWLDDEQVAMILEGLDRLELDLASSAAEADPEKQAQADFDRMYHGEWVDPEIKPERPGAFTPGDETKLSSCLEWLGTKLHHWPGAHRIVMRAVQAVSIFERRELEIAERDREPFDLVGVPEATLEQKVEIMQRGRVKLADGSLLNVEDPKAVGAARIAGLVREHGELGVEVLIPSDPVTRFPRNSGLRRRKYRNGGV